MRKVLLMIAVIMVMVTMAGCGAPEGERVFDVKNVDAVDFFKTGTRESVSVPREDLDEILEWLGTFTVGSQTEEYLIPGSNYISVRIVYGDGTVLENSLSTITRRSVLYYMDAASAPKCYLSLVNGTLFPSVPSQRPQ